MSSTGKVERFDETMAVIGELHWDERPGGLIECHLDVIPGRQRTGIGTSMLSELEAQAKASGKMALISACAGDNSQALGFFCKNGFAAFLVKDLYGLGRDGYFLHRPIGAPK